MKYKNDYLVIFTNLCPSNKSPHKMYKSRDKKHNPYKLYYSGKCSACPNHRRNLIYEKPSYHKFNYTVNHNL